jgi:glycosyltransferase involved in cell wall biosynthesis
MRTLYLSHNGMTEPLGHAQVLPYLIGVARRGVDVEILSFERAGTSEEALAAVRERLTRERIAWRPMVRSRSHGLPVKAAEAAHAVLRGLAAALRRRPQIVHARSYLPAAAADLIAKLSPRAQLLFDVRGMLADESADAGVWPRASFRYRLVKRWERHLLRAASGVVVLTEALRSLMWRDGLVPAATSIDVVPCCVDEDAFLPASGGRERMRHELGFGSRPVLVYSGTLGSWYKAREMAQFAGLVRQNRPDVALLLLTQSDASEFLREARANGFEEGDVRVRSVSPSNMPAMLAAGDVGLSFIEPCFSKIGSSPTKVAEYLAAGSAVVVNDKVGDQGALSSEPACVVLPTLSTDSLAAGARAAARILDRPYSERARLARSVAHDRFSLAEIGVPRYMSVYERLSRRSRGTA